MSSHSSTSHAAPLDLSKWRNLPNVLIGAGAVVGLIGAFAIGDASQFGRCYLVAFMFALSLVLGSLFIVLLHHLFDAMWLIPLRRFCEHIACLAPVMFVLFLPIMYCAGFGNMYTWMSHPHDHAVHSKAAYLNPAFWYIRIFVVFTLWTVISWSLRSWSLAQDKDGGAQWTMNSRKMAAFGIIAFAFSLTVAAIDWTKSLEYQWFSTMYGVSYFAASVWTTLATVYVITAVLARTGHLKAVVKDRTMHDCGVLFFAFTVFYAYIHFSQYFLIWNAALAEETFWFIERENGYWWDVGMLILFGHFFLPFLTMLRIDAKKSLTVMVPLCAWAWLMHFIDMGFNILPGHAAYNSGQNLGWVIVSAGCLAFMLGVMSKFFLKWFNANPPYPQRDPRIAEAMGVYVRPLSEAAGHGAK